MTNLGITAITVITGVMSARLLGPSGRGEFAVLVGVMAIGLVVAELGQSAAVTYHIAAKPHRVAGYISAATRIMTQGAGVVASVGVLVAILVGDRTDVTNVALVLMCCLVNVYGGPATYAMQAIDLNRWNVVRLSQPLAFLALTVVLWTLNRTDVTSFCGALLGSTVVHLAVAQAMVRRLSLGSQKGTPSQRRDLLRFGSRAALAGIPQGLTQHADRFLLALLLTTTDVGIFAVAASVASLTLPFAMAASSVALPQVASLRGVAALDAGSGALRSSVLGGLISCAVIALVAVPLLPIIYGEDFGRAQVLALLMLPGMAIRSVNLALLACLRGIGQPTTASTTQLLSMFTYFVCLIPATLASGLPGAAIALAVGEGAGLAIGITRWRACSKAVRAMG